MKKKDFLTDYCAYILYRALSPLVCALPLAVSFWIARRLGDLTYLVDRKHRAIAFSNITIAFGRRMKPAQLRRTTRRFFQSFAQNVLELFLIPRFDARYVAAHVDLKGLEHVRRAFARGKGIIFVAMHAGSWELSGTVAAQLGVPFRVLVRAQRLPRLEGLLNSLRGSHKDTVILREHQLRRLITVLRANESVAMTIDQGGRTGVGVRFFGKDASMASGALRLAFKLDCALVPVMPLRIRGARIAFHALPAFELVRTGDEERDIRDNLQRLVQVFEGMLEKHPHEYLWSYRVWKYSRQRLIMVLSDGKAGHLSQAQALASITAGHVADASMAPAVMTQEVAFRTALLSRLLALAAFFSPAAAWRLLDACLDRAAARAVQAFKPDIIISCGARLVPVNLALARLHRALSFVVMRPSVFSVRRFDLVVMPRHDRPPKRKNVVIVDGSLNQICPEYLKKQKEEMIETLAIADSAPRPCIGLLLGGDTADFKLCASDVLSVIGAVKEASESTGSWVMATTSRRTPRGLVSMVKHELGGYSRSKWVVIASEKNYPFALGAILASSTVLVVSPESVSMVSEAASSGRHTLVFEARGLSRRHQRFLDNLAARGFIRLVKPAVMEKTIRDLVAQRPAARTLNDGALIRSALRRVI